MFKKYQNKLKILVQDRNTCHLTVCKQIINIQ